MPPGQSGERRPSGGARATSGRHVVAAPEKPFARRLSTRVVLFVFAVVVTLSAASLFRREREVAEAAERVAVERAAVLAAALPGRLAPDPAGERRLPPDAPSLTALAAALRADVGADDDRPILLVVDPKGRSLIAAVAEDGTGAPRGPELQSLRSTAAAGGGPARAARARWWVRPLTGNGLDGGFVAAGVSEATLQQAIGREVLWRFAFLAVALVVAAFLFRPFLGEASRDLSSLLAYARSSGAGDASVPPPRIERPDEIGSLGRVLVDSLERLRSARLEAERATKALEERAEIRTGALNRANEELKRRAEELAAASRAKDEFLANVSHELRTPLNSIIGLTQLVREGAADSKEEADQFLEQVLASSRHLLQLINGVLDLAKLEAGGMEIHLEAVTPADVVREACGIVEPLAVRKGLAVSIEPVEPGVAARADRLRLRQVLVNLLDNAVKFTEKGSVTVRVTASDGRRKVLFVVEDTGIGIPPERRAAVFEKFIQAEAGTTRRYGGTGLGLPISRLLVEAMGGAIGVEDAPEGGTRVWFTLPAPGMEGR